MTSAACPFCAPDASRIFHAGPLTLALWDAFPLNQGHALLVPKRHVATWFEATADEQTELLAAVQLARQEIESRHAPDGYNIGINIGEAAGQTVNHLHVHVIPRYDGDVDDPRGGVRHVIPERANYLATGSSTADPAVLRVNAPPAVAPSLDDAPHTEALVSGGSDPLLPHIRAHLDGAQAADLAIAFVLESGLRLIEDHMADLLDRGGRLRLLAGDYLGVTEPNALLRLLDLQQEYPDHVELRIFESAGQSFHPKAYVFRASDVTGVALVGSSNLSRSGLCGGVEWSVRAVMTHDRAGFATVSDGFDELFVHPKTRVLDAEWVEKYRARRPKLRSVPERATEPPDAEPAAAPEPHVIQKRALAALEATRESGNTAGLVVLGTGLGKTWLAAFDSNRPAFKRVLFIAHREEILKQALSTFRRIRPEAALGFYNGQEKAPDADVLFASIQTLGRKNHLHRFERNQFDYVIVDEFHHAAAQTYRRVIDYFDPGFLLGLTATPERTDGGDLLGLCQENLVIRCDMSEGICEGLLSPFHYFGVPDEVDYANIPWRSSRFDEEELTNAVATQSRAQNALEQLKKRGGKRTLAFCCSTRHADFMREYFRGAGLRAASVHSQPSSDPRASSLEQLGNGDLDVLFAVDMFNEGVDLPKIDTVMMLRPTESRILWLQQFGRGLRKAEGKDHLNVIDYIGNHRTFLLKPQTLFELPAGDAAIDRVLNLLAKGEAELPPGCQVTYELEAVDILRGLLRKGTDAALMRYHYEDFKQRYGQRPTASEMYHEGFNPRSVKKSHGSWFGYVRSMGDLNANQQSLIEHGRAADFLSTLESTPMTRSFKMLVLLAMLNEEQFPGELSAEDLCAGVRRIARRSEALHQELDVSLDDMPALRAYLEKNPIKAWAEGRGTGGTPFFDYDDGRFRTNFGVDADLSAPFAEMVRELVDWRLAEYLGRSEDSPDGLSVSAEEPGTGLVIGRPYMRETIPRAFEMPFIAPVWQQGFVHRDDQVFLLVSLDKTGMAEEHKYGDRFLSRDLFEWESQNRHTQHGKPGQMMRHHVDRGIPVHLLVRKQRKIGQKAAPFVYCGQVEFAAWEGEQPITIRWQLREPLSPDLARLFGVD